MQTKKFVGKLFRSAVFSLSLILAGCSSGVTGKWVNPQDPKDYYEFKSNGTWFAEDSSGKHETGTYAVDHNQITLKMSNGTLAKITIKDTMLTTANGKIYQSQKLSYPIIPAASLNRKGISQALRASQTRSRERCGQGTSIIQLIKISNCGFPLRVTPQALCCRLLPQAH